MKKGVHTEVIVLKCMYIAVRLEMWKNNKMQGYKYQEDKEWAQATYSWTGVDVYQSRHSINDTTTNKELVVRSLRDD